MKIGPKYKIARRLGAQVFEKTQTAKFALVETRAPKGKRRGGARSEYARQLIERQRTRFTYGITARQLNNYTKKAAQGAGKPSDTLYKLLESRLDNVVYRLGIASTRRAARQMVSHGHILVNGVRTNIPSREIRIGEIITIRGGSKGSPLFLTLSEKLKEHTSPSWLSYDTERAEGKVTGVPIPDKAVAHFDLAAVLESSGR